MKTQSTVIKPFGNCASILLAVAFLSFSAHSAPLVLDQSVTPPNPPCCAFGVNASFPLDSAQTFTVGVGGLLSRVDVFVQGVGFNWDVRPVTATQEPLADNSAALAHGSFIAPSIGFDQYSFVMLDFSSTPIPVVAGEKLAIVLSASAQGGGWGASDAGYVGGDAWQRSGSFNNGFAWTLQQPGNDLGFRTFVAVPEPTSGALFGLAAAVFATWRVTRSVRPARECPGNGTNQDRL